VLSPARQPVWYSLLEDRILAVALLDETTCSARDAIGKLRFAICTVRFDAAEPVAISLNEGKTKQEVGKRN
jgi:hypothetical protein